jgi:hypothetical protein
VREFDDAHLDVASRHAKPRPLVLDRVHCLDSEGTSFHLLDRSLLIGNCFHEELATHVRAMADVVKRSHGVAEGHATNDEMRLDVDLQLAIRPRHFPTHDGRVVGAFFGADSEVNAVGKVVAVVERRVVVVVDGVPKSRRADSLCVMSGAKPLGSNLSNSAIITGSLVLGIGFSNKEGQRSPCSAIE